MAKYILERSDGGVSIMNVVEGSLLEEIRKWEDTSNGVKILSSVEVVDADIPIDRTFRDAWTKLPSSGIQIDMPKAREIWRDYLRSLRGSRLRDLDVAYIRALEINDRQEMNRITALKQALRDVTQNPAIEAAQTPEQLKAFIPEILNG